MDEYYKDLLKEDGISAPLDTGYISAAVLFVIWVMYGIFSYL